MSDRKMPGAPSMIDAVAAAEDIAGRDRNHQRRQGRKTVGILQ
jgi:hypothetical protein